MAKLRHIAFISLEPKNLSDFYQNYFALEEVKIFPSGSRMVIDGLFNLSASCSGAPRRSALHPKAGVQYFGIQVSDLASVRRSLESGGVEVYTVSQGQIQLIDPEGNRVIVSERDGVN